MLAKLPLKTPRDIHSFKQLRQLIKDPFLDAKKRDIIQEKLLRGVEQAFVRETAVRRVNQKIIEGQQKQEEAKGKRSKGN